MTFLATSGKFSRRHHSSNSWVLSILTQPTSNGLKASYKFNLGFSAILPFNYFGTQTIALL
ncbi:hypothetical protein LC605_31970 [Nostoc sp. CHAB 5836]|uniref:hypothetical protein n=1 Tax=Nostoc sp. CHAB 5836 TaxID=2780404 RepID=UPI001E4B8BD8|nr:hypothetical protein [Nostoc sp. CHAB 5836]MCC5619587.1 hypothetical protein [Nostoc sp. CHAB 5836]